MASPQKENGYLKTANEIQVALCRFRIPGEARQVLDVILYKTYGFNKKQDGIALSTFVLMTGLSKRNICRAIETLKKMNIIIVRNDNAPWNYYAFNKDFDKWKPLSKQTPRGKALKPLSETTTVVVRNDNASLSETTPSKDNSSKDNITDTTKVVLAEPEKEKKYKQISDTLLFLCQCIGIDDFASSNQLKRNFGNHLLGLGRKLGKEEFLRRLDILKNDSYKANRLNQIDFLYRELRGFKEPIIKKPKVFILNSNT